MATHRLWIPAKAFSPDTSGNCYPKYDSIDMSNDRFPDEILAFKDSGTRVAASTKFGVPKNYVSTPKIVPVFMTTATSGDVVLDADTKAVADGESFDPSTDDDAVTATVTVPGTARLRKDQSMDLSGTYAADDVVLLKIARDGAQGADTLAAEMLFVGAWFQYADA